MSGVTKDTNNAECLTHTHVGIDWGLNRYGMGSYIVQNSLLWLSMLRFKVDGSGSL